MKALVLFIALPLCAQIQTFTGVNGLGHSTLQCIDRDGDGYGVGPLVAVNTTLSSSASVGATSISVTSAAGISTGYVLRLDLVQNMEKVVVSGVSGTTLTVGALLLPHASGATITDQGCLGRDADDNDPLIWSATQSLFSTKYPSGVTGSTAASLFGKIANDIILENPIPNGSAAAIAAGYASPHAIWYLAPASPSANCVGTTGQCTGSDSNACTLNAPCITFARLTVEGYTTSDMVILRDAWNSSCTPQVGTSSKYAVLIAFPGEKPQLSGSNNCNMVGTVSVPYDYIVIDGLSLASSSSIGGGSQDVGTAPVTSSTFHDILLRNIEGAGGPNAGTGIGWISTFNGLNNYTIEWSNLHGNDCTGGGCQHGIYNGSRMMVSANVIYRGNLAWQNDSNGLTFNGQCFPGCEFIQNISYSNGISGLTLEMGVKNALVESNLIFSNANGGLTIFNYPGNCSTQGGGSGNNQICPFDQTGNLIENNTILQTGNVNVTNPNSSPGSCPGGISYCGQAGINVNNTTSPLAGNLGSNTYRNNIITSYGYSNHYSPVVYGDPTSSGTCDSTCTGWLAADVWNHNDFYQTDGNGGTGTISFGPGSGFGFAPYTCSTATAHTTMTNCQSAIPGFLSGAISNWNSEANFDLRLSASANALHAGGTTSIPAHDVVGRAFLDDTPSEGALERNLYATGWNDLGSATQVVPPANGYPSFTNNITFGGTGGTCTMGSQTFCYPFATEYTNAFKTWSDAILRETAGKTHMLVSCDNGGHTDFIGNACESFTYNTASPAWSRLSGPSTFVGEVTGTGAVFTTTVSGGALVLGGCTVSSGGSGYTAGEGGIAWTPTGGDTITNPAQSIYDVVGGVVTSCANKSNALGAGYNHVPTGAVPNLTTPALAYTNAWVSGNAALAELGDGTPSSRHMTGLQSYNPTLDQMVQFNGGLAGGNGPHFQDTWALNFGTFGWLRLDPTSCGAGCGSSVGSRVQWPTQFFSGFSGMSVFDPIAQDHFFYFDDSGGVMSTYNPSNNQTVYAGLGGIDPSGAATTNGFGNDIIPDRRRAYFIGAKLGPVYQASYVDLSKIPTPGGTSSETVITSSIPVTGGTSCAGWWQENISGTYYSPGLAWDQAIGKFVAFTADGSSTWYTMDPDSFNCATNTSSGGPGTTDAAWLFGKFRYSADVDAFPVFQGFNASGTTSQDAFVLSLNAPDPTGTAVCGITPTSLPGGTVGVAYSQVLTNANCSASTWSITGGSLPVGLSGCNSGSGTTCTISGTPTGAGTSTFTANYSTAANPLSITVAAGVTVKGVSAGNGIMTGIQ